MPKLNINNGGVDTNKKMPDIDERFGPYTSIEAADSALGGQGRNTITAGLTVGILTANAGVKEWWYQPNKKTGQLELIPKGGNAADNPTEGNFASFDSNGNVVDSGNKADDFAPIEQAVPMGDTEDVGKILEKQKNGFGWVDKPVDGADAYHVWLEANDFDEQDHPVSEYNEYNRGKSAREIYNQEKGTDYDDAQFIEAIKANYPMKYVSYNATAYSATSPFDSIGSLDAGEATEGKLWFMPNNDNTETKLFITVNNGTAESPSYKWHNMGVVDVPSNTLTKSDVDNECVDGATDEPASAKAVMDLKVKLEGVTRTENKVVYTAVTGSYVKAADGSIASSSGTAYMETALDGATSVRFLGLKVKTIFASGYAFGHYDDNTWVTDKSFAWDVDTSLANSITVEIKASAPSASTHFRTTTASGSISALAQNFYCYLQSGESVGDIVNTINDKLHNVTFEEDEVLKTNDHWIDGMVVGNTGKILTSNPANKSFQCLISDGVKEIRFLGRTRTNDSVTSGYALGYYDEGHDLDEDYWNTVFSTNWETASNTTTKEIVLQLDEYPNAKYFRTLVISVSTNILTKENFYCYFIKGNNILTDDDIAEGLYSEKKSFVLGTGASKVIDHRTKRVNLLSKYSAHTLSWTINSSRNEWEKTANSLCTLIDIRSLVGKKLKVVKAPNKNTHIAFLTSATQQLDSTPTYADGTGLVLLTTTKERTLDIPLDAARLYVKLSDGTIQYNTFGPESIEIIDDNEEDIIASNRYCKQYDYTYIEENIYQSKGILGNGVHEVIYKIDREIPYMLILAQLGDHDVGNGVTYLDDTFDEIVEGDYSRYPHPMEETFTSMQPLGDIPENCAYIKLTYYLDNDTSGVSKKGIGALMKPLKDDGSIPTNRSIYCVSRIYSPAPPNAYSDAEYVQEPIWSAWSFVMPLNADSRVFGKPIPVCSWFHGSSTCLTPDHFGNFNNWDSSSMVYKIRQLGCIVFDINGYGVSYKVDDAARHWGCPLAVETAKRAYEIIVERFNGRRGFINCGWSMGGAIAKSYAMTYPSDVMTTVLFAPSEIGGNGRFHNPVSGPNYHVSEASMAHAWGYETYQDMYADHTMTPFIGYSPCVKPHVIIQDGTGIIRKIRDDEFLTSASIYDPEHSVDNTNVFVGSFPGEVRVWAGTADDQVPYYFAPWFVNTVRNAGGNATLRTCIGGGHGLFADYGDEILSYLKSKIIK